MPAEDDDVSMWSDRVNEPFRSDRRFWWSLSASVASVVTLVLVSVVVAAAGRAAAVAYVAPLLLLAVAANTARSSSAATRPQFATRELWRDAEREAVASALLLRRRSGASDS